MISFTLASPLQIETAFKFAGLDEHPRYQDVISSLGMAQALKREGYRGILDNGGVIKPVK